jgi:hypothetical protein
MAFRSVHVTRNPVARAGGPKVNGNRAAEAMGAVDFVLCGSDIMNPEVAIRNHFFVFLARPIPS